MKTLLNKPITSVLARTLGFMFFMWVFYYLVMKLGMWDSVFQSFLTGIGFGVLTYFLDRGKHNSQREIVDDKA